MMVTMMLTIIDVTGPMDVQKRAALFQSIKCPLDCYVVFV